MNWTALQYAARGDVHVTTVGMVALEQGLGVVAPNSLAAEIRLTQLTATTNTQIRSEINDLLEVNHG
jgi:hypothetical protein